MNERIKQLEDQCWVQIPCDFDMRKGGLSTINTVFDRKKFAELIVKECLVQSDGAIPDTNCSAAGAYKTAKLAATSRVKNHFGVWS